MRIVVREVLNERGKISEQGQKLHDLIAPVLARGEEVEVDFTGSHAVGTPLLSTAIGQLLKDNPLECVRSLLRVQGLEELERRILERVIEKSHRYYSEPRYREAADRALERMFEDR
jgi:hypothetical protein